MYPELESYVQVIEHLRSQIGELIAGLTAEALNWQPVEGTGEHATNSLAVLATHVAGSEHYWIGEVAGRLPATRIRDAEFAAEAGDAAPLLQLLEERTAETRQVLSALEAADLESVREMGDRTVTVRWCILHVIEHTALHLGHMQLTYQLWRLGAASLTAPATAV